MVSISSAMERYRADPTRENGDGLIRSDRRLIYYAIAPIAKAFRLEDDELFGAAAMVFLGAARAYDPRRGVWSTLAVVSMRRKAVSEARRLCRHSREAGSLCLGDKDVPRRELAVPPPDHGEPAAETVRALLATLPEPRRTFVRLNRIDGVPFVVIARHAGISATRVGQQIRAGIRQMAATAARRNDR